MVVVKYLFSIPLIIGFWLVRLVCLPFLLFSSDRIEAANAYAISLAWPERLRQEQIRGSLLALLIRAARRQEMMNARGREVLGYFMGPRRRSYAFLMLRLTLAWRFTSLAYGCWALWAFLETCYPSICVALQPAIAQVEQSVHEYVEALIQYVDL